MNILPEDERIPLNKKDMMGQPLLTGDIVWRFSGGRGSYSRSLTVVLKETPQCISVLDRWSWGSRKTVSVGSDNLLKHKESWKALNKELAEVSEKLKQYQEENK